mmetsp:Transcript_25612/g.59176  ORF Transcript_25612/g.59176 Transcript_25612/m.59176 type:complete len:653 (+) Transcript_25612:74-2032(+)
MGSSVSRSFLPEQCCQPACDEGYPTTTDVASVQGPQHAKGAMDVLILAACCKGLQVEEDEIPHALACLGLYPSLSEVEQALKSTQLRAPIAFRDFQLIAGNLLTSGCDRGKQVVPFSRRGLSVLQLGKIRDAFISNGWLDLKCEDYNVMNEDSIGVGAMPKRLEDFYSLVAFVIAPLTDGTVKSRSAIPGDQLDKVGIPSTPPVQPCSYSELVCPCGCDVDYFVSHHWGQSVTSTLKAIESFAAEKCPCQGRGAGLAQEISCWMSCFALDQHASAAAPHGLFGFQLALSKAMDGMLLVVDDKLHPFRRLWCLYELYMMHQLGGDLQIITETGSYGRRSSLSHKSLVASLTQACALSTWTKSPEDRLEILADVMSDAAKLQYQSLEQLRAEVTNPPREYCVASTPLTFADFDTSVRGVLAEPLLREALIRGACDEAIQFLGFNQNVGISDLQRISAHGGDLHAAVPSILFGEVGKAPLTYIMAEKGRVEELCFLLEYGLSVHACGKLQNIDVPYWRRYGHGSTALHAACWAGHKTSAKVLLEVGAFVNARNSTEATPLWLLAAAPPHAQSVPIAQMLLEYRADLAAPAWMDRSPLHAACESSNLPIAEFLLENGASANTQDADSATPLHLSCVPPGRKEIVALLLSHPGIVKG